MTSRTVVITGAEKIRNVRVLVLRSALKLEVLGMGRRGRSAYAIIKKEFGFRGNKQRVLDQLNKFIHENILPEAIQ